MLATILLVFAFVLLVIEAFYGFISAAPPKIHPGWLGLALWVLSILLRGVKIG